MESSLTARLPLTLTGKTVRATDVSQERDDRRLVPLQHLQGGVAPGAAFQHMGVEQHTRVLYYDLLYCLPVARCKVAPAASPAFAAVHRVPSPR